jgi:hypothetical protein
MRQGSLLAVIMSIAYDVLECDSVAWETVEKSEAVSFFSE